ncbi:MAG: ComEC/Rec2 family competence protein [Epsilonproteobacteria bacterium]|nr:hypothetical protein [Campylobacterota bacterium]NPA56573.1 ComEC/Rec2 family competence protein [Campylobacterota bacterium]
MERLPLFTSFKERLLFLSLLLFIASISLALDYSHYRELLQSRFFHTEAVVVNQYTKDGREILKLRTPHFTFYTSTREEIKDLRDRRVRVMIIRTRRTPSFLDFLKGSYWVSYIEEVLPKDRRFLLKEMIARQHRDPYGQELFGALFLATSLSKELRERLSALGLSHLVAISGLHLTIIIGAVTLFTFTLLRPLFQRCCPFIHLRKLSMVGGFAVALGYLLFVGEIPSLVRAFALSLAAFWLYDRHIQLLSFELLGWVATAVVALYPQFLFSLGFWLSVAGVFSIYLFLHHYRRLPLWFQLVALNFWVYLMISPVTLTIFGLFSWWQLLSPLISLLFPPFYLIALLLHLLGVGGLLDPIVSLLHNDIGVVELHLPRWFLWLWLLGSLLSIYKHWIVGILLIVEIVLAVHYVT